jgi:hypothetical protein
METVCVLVSRLVCEFCGAAGERKAAREPVEGGPVCVQCGGRLAPWEVEGEPCDRCADGGAR